MDQSNSQNVIIVGVDGSETADQAANRAAELARDTGARLQVITAYESDSVESIGVGSDQWIISTADDAAGTAEAVAARLRSVTPNITSAARGGKPADVLVEEAKELNARLIVVGNVRMQGLGRILGSVANGVAHHAPCDVYIVKTT